MFLSFITSYIMHAFIRNSGCGVQGATSHCLEKTLQKCFKLALRMKRG